MHVSPYYVEVKVHLMAFTSHGTMWDYVGQSHCVPPTIYLIPVSRPVLFVPWYNVGLCGTIPLCTTHYLAYPSVPSCTIRTMVQCQCGTMWYNPTVYHTLSIAYPSVPSCTICTMVQCGTMWYNPTVYHTLSSLSQCPVLHYLYHGTMWDYVVQSHYVPHTI